MADFFSASSTFISLGDFIFNIATSTIFNDNGIGDRGNDPEKLALRIENIKNKLYTVDERQLSDLQKHTFQNLRVAVLDAEDILDREETLAKKQQLKEADEVITHETNDTEILSSLYASFQSSANKAWDMLSSWNKADEMKIKEMLDAIDQELQTIELKEPSNRDLSWKRVRASGSQVNATRIAGRDADKREVIKLLLSSAIHKEKILVVSVVGIGGMGKTTLAQLVYEDKAWQGSSFDLKIWVSDSKQFDMKSLLKSILKSISPNEGSIIDGLEKDQLKERLVQEIRGKRFFLVLDDVENENPLTWEELEALLNYGSKEESRILVTTRSRKVAKDIMGSLDSTYPLKGLSEEDSLQLFERYAFRETRDENLAAIGKLIVEKCAGVPLAIKVIGSLLRGKDKRKWEDVRDFGLATFEVKCNPLMPILKMSYDDLDPILKQCFSYCSLFPKNYLISKEILSSIWMANVRFKTDKGESIEDICNENLEILYNRCFLEVEERNGRDDDTYFKMHDLMHDLVKDVGGSEVVLAESDDIVESNKLIIEENVRHLSLFGLRRQMEVEIYQFKGRRLRTCLAACYYFREPLYLNKVVPDCPVLRFLDLSMCRIEILTDSIGMLIHLRHLDLSGNHFQTLPDSITELINLRCLKLNMCCALTRLPSRMGALTSLEVLHLSNCEKLEELPMGIEKLINLKDLKLYGCFALTRLPSGMGALTSLEVLDLAWCDKLTQLPPGMGALTSLQVLNMSYCRKLEEFPLGVEKLTNLKDLNFEGCYRLTQMPSGMPVCRSARFIVGHPESKHNAQLEELESVSDLPLGELTIEIPQNMKMTLKAPTGDGEAFLLNKKGLRRFGILWMREENGEEVVPKNQMDILAKLQPPPNLQEFCMLNYQGTTFPAWVPKEGFAAVLPNLEGISISRCQEIRRLPPISRRPHLKYMGLHWLNSLEYIEDDGVSGASFCASLEKLELWNLPELRGWCSTTGTIEQQELLMLPPFPRLLDLHIQGCPKLRVEPILVSIAKGISVKSEVEKELSEKREQTLPSFVPFFVDICREGGGIHLQMEEEKCEPPLALESSHLNAPDKKSMNRFKHLTELQITCRRCKSDNPLSMKMFVGALTELSKHLTHLWMWFCSGLKTLPGGLLQHLTALQHLTIANCSDFTGKEEEEEKQIQSASLETLKIGDSSISLVATCGNDSEMSWKGLQSLRSLTFIGLPKMEELPEGIQLLNSLKELNIKECDNLRVPEWLPKTFSCEGCRYTRLGHENRLDGQILDYHQYQEFSKLFKWRLPGRSG